MTSNFQSNHPQRRGATVAGLFGAALAGVLLLCGAGHVPIENFTPQGPMQADLNAGGHSITNAATVNATNVAVSGALTANGAQLTGLHGYTSESLSAAGTASLGSLGRVSEDTITLGAGTGAYTVNRSLTDAGAQAGDVWEINITYPASTNPTLNIYDNSTGGTLLRSSSGTGIAGGTTLQFVFNGTNWVAYPKGAILTKDIAAYQGTTASTFAAGNDARFPAGVTGARYGNGASPDTAETQAQAQALAAGAGWGGGVTGAITSALNGAAGLAGLDANGNLPLDPWSQVNYTPAQQEIIFIGDSISAGATLSAPLTTCYPYQFSQMPWAKNHATYYNFSSGGAVVPSGYTQGQAGSVTPTTQTATWSGATNTVTLSTANANILSGEFVSGAGLPYGVRVSAVAGTTLTLNPAVGYTTGTIASGTNVTLTFYGNNITDLYTNYVHALRPSNVPGVKRAFLFVHCGINDLGGGFGAGASYSLSTFETIFSSFVATAQADGFIVIVDTVCPIAQGGVENWSYWREYQRWQLNDWLRSGGSGVPSCYVHDAAAVYTANTASLDAMTSDGLHPNLAAHILLANDLNNFMEAGGNFTRFGHHNFELGYDESGLVIGPTNNTLVGDNLALTYNTSGWLQGYTINSGYGEGTVYNGQEMDDIFTGGGAAGQLFGQYGGIPVSIKRMANGILAVGGNISAVNGSTSGATAVINGANGTLTLSSLPTPVAPVVTPGGTAGSSTYSYAYVAVAADGVTHSAPSATVTITNGNSSLTSNPNNIVITGVPGASNYWVYRLATTGSGNQGTTGKWYTASPVIGTQTAQLQDYGNLAASGTLPTAASTGQGQLNALSAQLGTGTSTTTLSTSATAARTVSFPDASGTVGLLTKITGALSAGTATISNAAILAASAIQASHLGTSAANAGALYVSALSAGSVTIKSTNASDNDTFVLTVQ